MRFLFRPFLTACIALCCNPLYASWINQNTAIADQLNAVVFWGMDGVLAGNEGLYYTTTGGNGPASWTRFDIINNSADSALYNNTQWNDVYSKPSGSSATGLAYACGEDTVNGKAVIMLLELPSLAYTILYQGSPGSALNGIGYTITGQHYYAVGDAGLIVQFDATIAVEETAANLTQDLLSIHFYQDHFKIGADGYHIYGDGVSPLLPTGITTSGQYHDDVWMSSNSVSYSCGNATYYASNLSYPAQWTNYDFGPLNGQTILKEGSYYFVGTDHGIFRSVSSSPSIMEKQLSSLTHDIRGLWDDPTTNAIFACGSNGVLLKSTNDGGPTKPYCALDPVVGACSDSVMVLGAWTTGTGNSCKWYMDGVQISSSCGNFNWLDTVPGVHTVSLVTTNTSWHSDTATTSFHVVDLPDNTMNVAITDSILCQEEVIDILLSHSDTGNYYSLHRLGQTEDYGLSTSGTGSGMTFSSDLLNESGQYYLRAEHNLAACYHNHLDTLNIEVEKTRAGLHSGLINAEVSEPVRFYESCFDADNYSWDFTPGANPATSASADPIVDYSTPGATSVTLICWSDDGCYDTTTVVGPTVYSPPSTVDSCWTNHNKDFDQQWPGFYINDVSDLWPADNGHFVTGQYHDITFGTQHGDSAHFDGKGGYLAWYTADGTLKWVVYGLSTGTGNHESTIRSVTQSPAGDIYISGSVANGWALDGNVYDNAGDSFAFPRENFIIKLDSLGRYKWGLTTNQWAINDLAQDHSGNIVAILGEAYTSPLTSEWYLGDSLVNTLSHPSDANWAMLKISEAGDILWHVDMDLNSVNGDWIGRVAFDYNNNLYVVGGYEQSATFYDAGTQSSTLLPGWGSNYGPKLWIAKFDSTGALDWTMRSITTGAANGSASARDIVTDSLGNIYICGSNDVSWFTYTHEFENTDGSVTSAVVGQYYVAHISPDGICQWIEGVKHAYYGYGMSITLHDSVLHVVGSVSQNNAPASVDFTSSDSTTIHVDFGQWDYFIASYDITGKLLKVCRSAFDAAPATGFIVEMVEAPDGSFYTGRNLTQFNGTLEHEAFGSSAGNNQDARDGLVTHFTPECGYCYLPGINEQVEVVVCLGSDYTMPDGTVVTNITETVVHVSHLIAPDGSDSTIFTIASPGGQVELNIAVNSVCYGGSYTFLDGTTQNNITGPISLQSFISNPTGCDSLITVDVTPLAQNETFVSATVCSGDSYTFPDGSVLPGITTQVQLSSQFVGSNGCDSIISTTVNPVGPFNSNQSEIICSGDSYTWPDGNTSTNIMADSTYTAQWISVDGCDSTETIMVNVEEMEATANLNGTTLIAGAGPLSFQWVDCDLGFWEMPGQTSLSYTPSVSGNYAVIATGQACVDTSACTQVTVVGIFDHEAYALTYFPNPTSGQVFVEFGATYTEIEYIITDVTGRPLTGGTEQAVSVLTIDMPAVPGLYFLQLTPEGHDTIVVPVVRE